MMRTSLRFYFMGLFLLQLLILASAQLRAQCSETPFEHGWRPPYPGMVTLIYFQVQYKAPQSNDPASATLTQQFRIEQLGMGYRWRINVDADRTKHDIMMFQFAADTKEFPPLSGNQIIFQKPIKLLNFSYDTKDKTYELREIDNWQLDIPMNTHYPFYEGECPNHDTYCVGWENELTSFGDGHSIYYVAKRPYVGCGEFDWWTYHYEILGRGPDKFTSDEGLVVETLELPDPPDPNPAMDAAAANPELFVEMHPEVANAQQTWDPRGTDEVLTDIPAQRAERQAALETSKASWNRLKSDVFSGKVGTPTFMDLFNTFQEGPTSEFLEEGEEFFPFLEDTIPLRVCSHGYGFIIFNNPLQSFNHYILLEAVVDWHYPWEIDQYRLLHEWIWNRIKKPEKTKRTPTGQQVNTPADRVSLVRDEQAVATTALVGKEVPRDGHDPKDSDWFEYSRCTDRTWGFLTRTRYGDPQDPFTYECGE